MPTPPPPDDTWLWDSSPVPSGRPGTPIRVSIYDRLASGDEDHPKYKVLDNVQCLTIDHALGAHPGHASFRYVFDGLDEDAPQNIEEALDTSIDLEKVVKEGDYLVVEARRPDGAWVLQFYGRAMTFGLVLDQQTEEVHITATGYAQIAWDKPIGGAYMRDASDVLEGDDFETDLVAQFNP